VTYLAILGGFGLGLLIHPSARDAVGRVRLVVAFGAGVLVGLAPLLVLLAIAPHGVLLGIVQYPVISAMHKVAIGDGSMSFAEKVGLLKDLAREPGTLALLVAFGLAVPWRRVLRARLDGAWSFPLALSLLVLPFLLAAALAPTPVYRQYAASLVPFLVLATVFGMAFHAARGESAGLHAKVLLLVAVIAVSYGYKDYRRLSTLVRPAEWSSTRVHADGAEIRRLAGEGPVLTLAPIFPVEARLAIYPELATGPFAWRSAFLVPVQERARLRLMSPDEAPAMLAARPPRAILVNFEPRLEGLFVQYAGEHGFRPSTLAGGGVLWVAPR
jgi:hypothetical protein